MNAPERIPLPDVQSLADTRGIALDAVGVAGLRYPVTIRDGGRELATIATVGMAVALPPTVKGTHMSRFVELMESVADVPLDAAGLSTLADAMLRRLDAASGDIEMRFPWFVRKSAPVSGVGSLVDCDIRWHARAGDDRTFQVEVSAPVTSLCPCSKAIADYGAHNQRSRVDLEVELAGDMSIDTLVGIAERSASCEIYGLLKRADEKYVTERAYERPRFVEDLVREAAAALSIDPRVWRFRVAAENFESIHNHSAYGRVSGRGAAA
jgi:GTP cyclohydrolase FolE2